MIWHRQVEQLKAFAIRANLEREECLEKERALTRERVDETLNATPGAIPCREGNMAGPPFFYHQVCTYTDLSIELGLYSTRGRATVRAETPRQRRGRHANSAGCPLRFFPAPLPSAGAFLLCGRPVPHEGLPPKKMPTSMITLSLLHFPRGNGNGKGNLRRRVLRWAVYV